MVSLMCLHVWSIWRYIGSLSKQHSRCLWHPGRVFILCRSLIFSRSEPFRPEEQLLFTEGDIFLVTNLATLLGSMSFSWSNLPLEILFQAASVSRESIQPSCYSFIMDLNHSDQRNNFYSQKVQYSWKQIWRLRWGIDPSCSSSVSKILLSESKL